MRDCRGNEENWAGAVRTDDFLNWNAKPDLERCAGTGFEWSNRRFDSERVEGFFFVCELN